VTRSLCFAASIRAAESRALTGRPPGSLMRIAAQSLTERVAHHAVRRPVGAPIVALVGPGNNGGDALLSAMLLRERGFPASAWLLPCQAARPADAAAVLNEARKRAFPIRGCEAHDAQALGDALAAIRSVIAAGGLFIDGLFGIGLRRPLDGLARDWIKALNDAGAAVIAADLPSGIDADTGAVLGGADGVAPRCIETVTFIADKPGLRTGAALEHVGAVQVFDLGLDPPDSDGELIDGPGRLAQGLRRRVNAHKGSHGSVLLIGGAAGMRGALTLAGLGAQRAGAGKVFLATVDGVAASVDSHPELMSATAADATAKLSAIVVGCGMGLSEASRRALDGAWAADSPLIIDADGLNALAQADSQPSVRQQPTLLTPHPLEAARLLGIPLVEIQHDRIAAARKLAQIWRAFVILKGAGSVCAAPDGRWSIVAAGSPALATAGSGDVLAGVIAAFIAQGLEPWDALRLAGWVHGRAAENWSRCTQGGGNIGLAASELPEWVRQTLNQELNHEPDRTDSRSD
jgi:hydroxyethylthiazole kinase-like uncharacterized protein yjeF